MFRALQYIIILITIVMTGFYVSVYQPELVTKLLINCDVFGLSKVAKNEHERVEKIRALTIPYEEKQVLLNRTVFMQASTEMVKLALGDPKDTLQRPSTDPRITYTYFVYYLGEDKRPTVLRFYEDKLIEAYKGSSIDYKGSPPETKPNP